MTTSDKNGYIRAAIMLPALTIGCVTGQGAWIWAGVIIMLGFQFANGEGLDE
jgi:hypothetical protein